MAAIIRDWFRLPSARTRTSQVGVITAWLTCILTLGLFFGWSIRVAAFSGELGFAVILAVLACCLALGFRWIRLPANRTDWKRRHWLEFAMPGVILGIAASLFLPAMTYVVFLVLAIMLGAEAASWSWAFEFGRRKIASVQPAPPARLNQSIGLLEEETDAPILQSMTRIREFDREIIRGTARAEFTAGQRKQTVHLAFCPPLASQPEFQVEIIDGPDARIKTADLQTFGVRLEITLSQTASEDESVEVEFYAA